MVTAGELVKKHRYLMLSKSWCPDCHYAQRVFEKYKVYGKVHVVELDKLETGEAARLEKEFTVLSGRKWVPSIFVDGKFWGNEQTLAQHESHDTTAVAFREIGLY